MKLELNKEEIKNIQLDILNSIHQFCSERGIRYSLAFGTLLGAVRHQGYIPWDDDLDIMMPRPDYDRFVAEYQGTHQHYVVQTYKNNESYFLSLAKVYDNRTEQIIFPTKTGVFVDIFPIEGLPETEVEAKQYIDKYCKLVFHDILFLIDENHPLGIDILKRYNYLFYWVCALDHEWKNCFTIWTFIPGWWGESLKCCY